MLNEQELITIHRNRAKQTAQIIVLFFLVILARLWYLQIYKGEIFHQYSIKNRLREEIVRAPRGMIYDRNDELLVFNEAAYDLMITPKLVKKDFDTLGFCELIGIDTSQFNQKIKKAKSYSYYKSSIFEKEISTKSYAKIQEV